MHFGIGLLFTILYAQYAHTLCFRYTHYIATILLGALPLLMLVLIVSYTSPTQRIATTHSADRTTKLEAIGLNTLNSNVEDHGKFVTTITTHDKLKTSPITESVSGITDKILSLPKKIFVWLTDRGPTSTVQVPFNKSYAENYRYLIPRAAFFDNRVRGKYNNVTVILAHVIKTKVKLVGCVIDGHYTDKVELNAVIINTWVHQTQRLCTHDDVFIFCFDTPGRNNSKVSVMYENPKNNSEIFITDSEHPLFIPKSREYSKDFNLSTMTCTTVFGTPPHIGEWLRYQKMIGVDFVYINAVETFLHGDAYNDTFLQESIKNGFVQLMVWKEYLKPGALFYHSQVLYYQNCVYRFQGIYEYAIMCDTDDLVIPTDGRDIRQILQSLFDSDPKLRGVHNLGQFLHYPFRPKQKVGGIQLKWLRYFPGSNFNFNKILAGNFSQYMKSQPILEEDNFKSIHKLSATSDVGIHKVSGQMMGYTWIHAPIDVMYVAHLRQGPYLYNRDKCL